jgi:hypothetical protein
MLGIVMHIHNPSIQEAEAGELRVQGQSLSKRTTKISQYY